MGLLVSYMPKTYEQYHVWRHNDVIIVDLFKLSIYSEI